MAIGQADNTIAFTFSGPKHSPVDETAIAAAISAELGEPVPAAVPAAKEPSPEPAPTSATLPLTADPTPQSAPPPSDEVKTYKITVDGQELEVTEADLKSGHMRHRDYTQKTQQLADEKRAITVERQRWEQERGQIQTELAQIDAFLRDQNAIDTYRERTFGPRQALQAPQIDPNKPLTVTDVAQIAAYNAEQVRQSMIRDAQSAREDAQRALAAVQAQNANTQRAGLERDVDAHLHTLLEKFPVLKRFDRIDEELFADAAQYRPKSLEDAKVQLTAAAERKVAALRAVVDDEKKQAAIQAAKLKKTSPEAPGGTAPPRPAGKKLSMSDKDRSARLAAAEEDLKVFLAEG